MPTGKNVHEQSKALLVKQMDEDFEAFPRNLLYPQVPLILPSQLCEIVRISEAFFKPNLTSTTSLIWVLELTLTVVKHPFPSSAFLHPNWTSSVGRKASTFSSFLSSGMVCSTVPTEANPWWCSWIDACSVDWKSSGPPLSELSNFHPTTSGCIFFFVPQLWTNYCSWYLFLYSYLVFCS